MAETGSNGSASERLAGAVPAVFYCIRWAQAIFAISALLLILAMNSTTLVNYLGFMGLRTDLPDIVAVGDSCQDFRPGPPKLTPSTAVAIASRPRGQEAIPLHVCDHSFFTGGYRVETTAPAGEAVFLSVNGKHREPRISAIARDHYNRRYLRAGPNVLAFGKEPDVSGIYSSSDGYGTGVLGLFDLPYLRRIEVYVGPQDGTANYLGYYDDGGHVSRLYEGIPETHVTVDGAKYTISSDGFLAIEDGPDAGRPLPPHLSNRDYARNVEILVGQKGGAHVTLNACLPKDGAILQWVRDDQIQPAEFAQRIGDIWTGPDARMTQIIAAESSEKCRMTNLSWDVDDVSTLSVEGGFLAQPAGKLTIYLPRGDPISWSSDQNPSIINLIFDVNARLSDFRPTKSTGVGPTAYSGELGGADRSNDEVASSLASVWADADKALPSPVRALMSGVLLLLPALVLSYILMRPKIEFGTASQQTARRHGLLALLLLAAGVCAADLAAILVMPWVEILQLWDAVGLVSAPDRLTLTDPVFPCLLICAVVAVVLLSQRERGKPQLFAALGGIGVFLIPAALAAAGGFAVVQVAPWRLGGTWFDLPEILKRPETISLQFWGLLATAPLMTAIPIYCTIKAFLPGHPAVRASLLAGVLAVLLPNLVYFAEALRVLLAPLFEDSPVQLSLQFLSYSAAFLARIIAIILCLWALHKAFVAAAPEFDTPLCRRITSPVVRLVVAAVVAAASVNAAKIPPAMSSAEAQSLAEIFTAFTVAVVALVGISALIARRRDANDATGGLSVLVALISVYLARWTNQPLAAVVAFGVASLFFGRLILRPLVTAPPTGNSDVSLALIAYRRDQMLIAQRLDKLERDFAAGTVEYAAVLQARQDMEVIRRGNERALGGSFVQARSALLNFGPDTDAAANGLRGAAAGLVFAILMQVFAVAAGQTAISPTGSPARNLMSAAVSAVNGAQYNISTVARSDVKKSDHSYGGNGATRVAGYGQGLNNAGGYGVLNFFCAVLNSFFFWTLMGFLFGFAFDRIRGADGFSKGLAFGSGVAGVFLIEHLLTPSPGATAPLTLVPIFAFFVITGPLVFDASTVTKRGLDVARLADIYGVRTTLGYISFAGLLASFAPFAGAFKSLFENKN